MFAASHFLVVFFLKLKILTMVENSSVRFLNWTCFDSSGHQCIDRLQVLFKQFIHFESLQLWRLGSWKKEIVQLVFLFTSKDGSWWPTCPRESPKVKLSLLMSIVQFLALLIMLLLQFSYAFSKRFPAQNQ